jgi:2-polyprenyl-3-methyl-5-hydroxy-6-metoxy-1,4-benzoquinol methylase
MSEATRGASEDPAKDYRRRYELPDQFVWDEADWARIDFDGYTAMALGLLPSPPARVLDVGCGPGLTARRLLDAGYDVTGVDYNERAVAFANLLVPDASFVEGDVRELGALPGLRPGFDAAVCIEVLEHVPPADRPAVIRGIGSVLSSSATLVLTTPSERMSANRWDYARPGLPELRRLLEDAGFDVAAVRFQHRLTPWFDPRIWRLFSNSVVDLPALRRWLRRRFLARWNAAQDEARSGRYVVAGRRR